MIGLRLSSVYVVIPYAYTYGRIVLGERVTAEVPA
jgi:hypothetical protein